MADETEDAPWFAPNHVGTQQDACKPRPRERLWTLVKAGKRVDAELLFQGEHGVEVQFSHDGVMAYGQRFALRAAALAEADHHRARLEREGWTMPQTQPPID